MPETFMVFPPKQSFHECATIIQALGLAVVDWPSGRRTLEQYAATAAVSDLEAKRSRNADVLFYVTGRNLEDTMREFQRRSHKGEYFIREKKRRKARRVNAVTWVHPNEYTGPIPDAHGVLPGAG